MKTSEEIILEIRQRIQEADYQLERVDESKIPLVVSCKFAYETLLSWAME